MQEVAHFSNKKVNLMKKIIPQKTGSYETKTAVVTPIH